MQKSKFKFKIKKFIKEVNNLFIKVILFVFYFLIIGIIALIYKLFRRNKDNPNLYWEDFKASKFDLEYFKSAY